MGWLFLLASCWGAAFTYNVFRPHYRNPYGAALSFFAGWLTGELALLHVAGQILATLVFWQLGALETTAGLLGLLLSLLSWAGLVWHHFDGFRTVPVIKAALESALGKDYERAIPSPLSDHFESQVGLEPILAPFRFSHPKVERIRNIRFKRARGVNLKLDVFRRKDCPQDCPTILQIHGGGWIIGSKDEQGLPLMNHLASRGWVCVNADYRLSPHATWPEHLIDLKDAIRWIREEAKAYGANPDFLLVTGGSAGGHLAAMVALTQNDPTYQPGFESVDTSVDGCVPFYGVYDFTNRFGYWPNDGLAEILEEKILKASKEEDPEAYDRASPLSLVDETAPPFMIIHGDRDTLVPVKEARAFAELLRERSTEPVAYVEIPGAQHAFEIFSSLRTRLVLLGVERFAHALYAGYLARREAGREADTALAASTDKAETSLPPTAPLDQAGDTALGA